MSESTEQSMTEKADAAFRLAAAKVVRLARQTGTPIIVRDHEHQRIQYLSPDEWEEQAGDHICPAGRSSQGDAIGLQGAARHPPWPAHHMGGKAR
jgi:hypothetical protein